MFKINLLPKGPNLDSLVQAERFLRGAGLGEEIKTKGLKYQEFYWQPGYGAFSVSSSHRNIVCDYISNQKQHHQKITFIDEFYGLLKKYNVEIDNRYSLD